MADSIYDQISFNSGEWDPKLSARTDQAKYRSACRTLRNYIGLKTGGFVRRPGTIYKGTCKYTGKYAVRNIKFQYSPTTSFMLEVGHQYIRFYSNGLQVNVSSAATWVSGNIYSGGNYVTDPSDGQIFYCIATSSFSSATYPSGDPTHWVQQTILEVPTPYNAQYSGSETPWQTDIWGIVTNQENDVVYFVHPDYPPQKLIRMTNTYWVFQQVNYLTPALLDQNATDTTLQASATTGTMTVTASAPNWQTANFYQTDDSVYATLTGGQFTVGNTYTIVSTGGVSFTTIGASSNTVGVVFTATGIGTGITGTAGAIYVSNGSAISGTFYTDLQNGLWTITPIFQAGHVGSTWQSSSLRASAYIMVTGTTSGGIPNSVVTGGLSNSGQIKCLGGWEVHTYGVWSNDIAVQRSLDGGITWDTIRTVTGRSDRNVDITGTADQEGLFQLVITNNAAPTAPGQTNPRVVFECVDSLLSGLWQVTGFIDAFHVTANVISPLNDTNATEYWNEGAWSAVRGYPTAITSYQQRIVYGGSAYEPQRIWMTQTGDFENFDLGDGTEATDGLAFDLAAPGGGPVAWLQAQTDLFCGLTGQEWVINSGGTAANGADAPITPSNVFAQRHSNWGSQSQIPGLIVGDACLYVQRQGRTIRQMIYSIATQKYASQDMAQLSSHLFQGGIVDMAYQPQFRDQGILWAVVQPGPYNSQAILCGMTYELEQEVFGWHRHDTGGTDNFESVACIDGQGQEDDEVWVIVSRTVNNVLYRYQEQINPVVWEAYTDGTAQSRAVYVDCAVQGQPTSATISGLSQLIGRTVGGSINGFNITPQVVNGSGQITIPNFVINPIWSTGSTYQLGNRVRSTVAPFYNFTCIASAPFVSTVDPSNDPTNWTSLGYYDVYSVGLPITSQQQIMKLDVDPRAGPTMGVKKALSKVWLRLYESSGGQVWNGRSGSVPQNIRYQTMASALGTLGVAQPLFTGEYEIESITNTEYDPQVIVQSVDALPLCVLALIVKYDIAI